METERAEGIVLRTQPVTETSLLVTWYTREGGKLKTLAKGARRPKSPMRGKIDLFYQDEIVFLRSQRSDLHLLHECFLENPRQQLRGNVKFLAAASYACELTDVVTEVEDPNPALFQLLCEVLDLLEQRVDAVPLIWFELHVLNVTGWKPTLEGGSGVEKVLRSLATANAAGAQRVKLTTEQTRAACEILWRFREAQLGRMLRTQKSILF